VRGYLKTAGNYSGDAAKLEEQPRRTRVCATGAGERACAIQVQALHLYYTVLTPSS
jgi:hypothetical protein